MSLLEVLDTQKFEYADVEIKGLRLSFLSWPDIVLAGVIAKAPEYERPIEFTKQIFDHYKIFPSSTSKPVVIDELRLNLTRAETSSPDVVVMSPATAYSLYLQKTEVFFNWSSFRNYIFS